MCEELAKRLGSAVQLESPVVRVSQDSTEVQFELATGTTVSADGAILALPLPLLRELKMEFNLPELMQQSLDHLVMGSSAMINIELASATHAAMRWGPDRSLDGGQPCVRVE